MTGPKDVRSDAGFTLVELMVALSIFLVILTTICGVLLNVGQQTNGNIMNERLTQAGMLALNEVATEIRDLSNSYDNSVQASDTGTGDIVTMNATQLQFLSANNIVNNDAAGIIDANGGSFTTGCANKINITLSSGNLVQNQIVPTLASGQCTWSGSAGSATLVQNIEPLCAGSPCAAGSTGASIFTYFQRYPNQGTQTTVPGQVGEVTIGFAVLPPATSSVIAPVVLTQTVRLAGVLSDPS